MNIDTLKDHWNAYMAAYGSSDKQERLRLLEQCVADDVVFTNPAGDGRTRAGLETHIATFRQGFPGAYFTTDRILPQTDKLLAVWSLFKADGTKVATGYNFVRPGDDGRFDYMAGFF